MYPLGVQRRASPDSGPTEQDVPVRGPGTSPASSQIESALFLSSFDGNYLGLQPITLWPDTPSRNDKVSL